MDQTRQAVSRIGTAGVAAGAAAQPGQLRQVGLATQQHATAFGQGGVPKGASAQLRLGSAGGVKLKAELLSRRAALVQDMQS